MGEHIKNISEIQNKKINIIEAIQKKYLFKIETNEEKNEFGLSFNINGLLEFVDIRKIKIPKEFFCEFAEKELFENYYLKLEMYFTNLSDENITILNFAESYLTSIFGQKAEFIRDLTLQRAIIEEKKDIIYINNNYYKNKKEKLVIYYSINNIEENVDYYFNVGKRLKNEQFDNYSSKEKELQHKFDNKDKNRICKYKSIIDIKESIKNQSIYKIDNNYDVDDINGTSKSINGKLKILNFGYTEKNEINKIEKMPRVYYDNKVAYLILQYTNFCTSEVSISTIENNFYLIDKEGFKFATITDYYLLDSDYCQSILGEKYKSYEKFMPKIPKETILFFLLPDDEVEYDLLIKDTNIEVKK